MAGTVAAKIGSPHLPDTRHDARLASLAHAGRAFDWPGGPFFPLAFQRVAGQHFAAVANSIRRAHIAATSVTTFMLRDMADFRRFVMTFCYDSAVLEAKKLTKPFIYKGW
jgi:hypothetical protein